VATGTLSVNATDKSNLTCKPTDRECSQMTAQKVARQKTLDRSCMLIALYTATTGLISVHFKICHSKGTTQTYLNKTSSSSQKKYV
jgi:hypothetical protein